MAGWIRGLLYRLSYLLPFAVAVALGVHLYALPEPPPAPSVEPCNTLRLQFDSTRGHWREIDPALIDTLVDDMVRARASCMRDPGYVADLALVMAFDERWAEGRTLIEQAAREGNIPPDVATLLVADIGLDEQRWLRDEALEQRGPELLRNAEASARALLLRWPEWREAQSVYHQARMGQDDYGFLLPPAESPWIGFGRWARDHDQGLPQAAMIVLGFFAGLLAGFGLRSISRRHLLERTPVSLILQAAPGYVHLKGRLHRPPGVGLVQHPRHGASCLWYPGYATTYKKRTTVHWHSSTQPVLLRDGTGEALLELAGADVETPAASGATGVASSIPVSADSAKGTLKRLVASSLGGFSGESRGYFIDGDEVQVFGRLVRDDQALTRNRICSPGTGYRFMVLARGIESRLGGSRFVAAVTLGLALLAALLLVLILHEYLRVVPTPWDGWTG